MLTVDNVQVCAHVDTPAYTHVYMYVHTCTCTSGNSHGGKLV